MYIAKQECSAFLLQPEIVIILENKLVTAHVAHAYISSHTFQNLLLTTYFSNDIYNSMYIYRKRNINGRSYVRFQFYYNSSL